MTTAYEHLYEKLSQATKLQESGSGKKFNKGACILAETGVWRENVARWLDRALEDILVRHQVVARNGQELKLTQISIAIGETIAYELGLDEDDHTVVIPIGDIILESFLMDNTIKIVKESRRHDSPYLILLDRPVMKKAILQGTLEYKPENISTRRNKFGDTFIKGWGAEERTELFDKLIERNPNFIQAVNHLRQTAWRVNKAVLETVRASRSTYVQETLTLVKTKTPFTEYTLPIDANMESFRTNHAWKEDGTLFKGRADPRLQRLLSKRYEYDAIMLKAQEMPEVFYQEYTCDYRGRIYCTESFLQFQGTDLARGLFLFDEAKEITESGLKRLKVHIANCYNISLSKDCLPHYFTTDYKSILEEEGLEEISLDKLTLEDRVLFVENNYWKRALDPKAESPVSLLAALNELHNHATIEGYKSSLPIPVDGSNNGWQHLSAMSKDREAAELVSCTDVAVQKDFYVAVAKEMIKQSKWFNNRDIPMKHIRKGIAKRGAMTRAYSAGAAKIAENMYDDCHMYGFLKKYNIKQSDCESLAKVLIDAVNKVCKGPLDVKSWMQELATAELNSGQKVLKWVTPSGFPVFYERYMQQSIKVYSSIATIGQITHRTMTKKRMCIASVDDEGEVTWKKTDELIPDRRSYASGIAPNIVHSYDAAHMANVIVRFGKCFGAVHDSFSTHASDVDELLEITKDCFIEMYDVENWFDNFKHIFLTNKEIELVNPEMGEFNVNEVRNATYFFC